MTELEKMEKAKAEGSQVIGEFLEWLQGEKGVVLATYHEHSKAECGSLRWPECGIYSEQPVIFHCSTERLLAEFFEIDLDQVEREKQALLDEIRNTPPPPPGFLCPECGAKHNRGYFPPGTVGSFRCLNCGYQGPSKAMGQ
jgi:hypothetical protein